MSSLSHDFNSANCEGLFIGISGLIGAGKSTLATALAKELNLPVYYEPVIDNVYLADFYQDMQKYSFQLQVYLLNKRFKQQQQIIWEGKGGVQDRTIYEDSVFARMLRDSGHLEERDFRTYMELFGNMSNFMKKPNVIVHLDALYNAYEHFIADIARVIPVIKVDYSRFRTAEEMAKVVKAEYAIIANVRHVHFDNVI
ncbi:dak, partial [Symbiodinium microadriaticum]